MSRRLAFAGLLTLAATSAVPADRFGVGRAATPDEIRQRDISVAPNGAGLPPGRGSAVEGRTPYLARCASCHGVRGEGIGEYPAVAGGIGSLRSDKPQLTVGSYWPYATTVWDYIHRAMPYEQPGTLTSDEVYSLTAYLLFVNGIVGETQVLDAASLPAIQMPNRNGFVPDARPDVRSKGQPTKR